MRQDKLSKQNIILYLCGMLPVVWIALLIAPHLHGGLPETVDPVALHEPRQLIHYVAPPTFTSQVS